MYFTADQRAAFRRTPQSAFSSAAAISGMDQLFGVASTERQDDQADIPVFAEAQVREAIGTREHETLCFLTYDLSVIFHTYSNNRKTINSIIQHAKDNEYLIKDAIVCKDNISSAIVISKLDKFSVQHRSAFIPNYNLSDKFFDISFRSANDTIRIKSLLSGDFYEPVLLQHVMDHYEGGAVLDVGANVGNHSVFFGHYLKDKPGFSLDSIEPEASAHQFLSENLAKNVDLQKVTIHNLAVGAASGSVELNNGSPNNLGAAKVTRSSEDDGLGIPMRALDDVISPDKKVSIIKMDIEGFEPGALKGARRILSDHSPILYIEADTEGKKQLIDDVIHPLGYRSDAFINDTPTHIYFKAGS